MRFPSRLLVVILTVNRRISAPFFASINSHAPSVVPRRFAVRSIPMFDTETGAERRGSVELAACGESYG